VGIHFDLEHLAGGINILNESLHSLKLIILSIRFIHKSPNWLIMFSSSDTISYMDHTEVSRTKSGIGVVIGICYAR
jgi:hypothetical protein